MSQSGFDAVSAMMAIQHACLQELRYRNEDDCVMYHVRIDAEVRRRLASVVHDKLGYYLAAAHPDSVDVNTHFGLTIESIEEVFRQMPRLDLAQLNHTAGLIVSRYR